MRRGRQQAGGLVAALQDGLRAQMRRFSDLPDSVLDGSSAAPFLPLFHL